MCPLNHVWLVPEASAYQSQFWSKSDGQEMAKKALQRNKYKKENNLIMMKCRGEGSYL